MPNLLDAWKSSDRISLTRCYFAENIEVVVTDDKACAVVATCGIPSGTIVLVEGGLAPTSPPPAYLHPSSTAKIPPCVSGFPFFVFAMVNLELPSVWVNYLRYILNAYQRLYGIGSAFCHSCAPNARRTTRDDGLSAIVTNSNIEVGDEITLSYSVFATWPYIPTCIRRLHLFRKFGFWCQCKYCKGCAQETREQQLRFNWATQADDVVSMKAVDLVRKKVGKKGYATVTADAHKDMSDIYFRMEFNLLLTQLLVVGTLVKLVLPSTAMAGLMQSMSIYTLLAFGSVVFLMPTFLNHFIDLGLSMLTLVVVEVSVKLLLPGTDFETLWQLLSNRPVVAGLFVVVPMLIQWVLGAVFCVHAQYMEQS